MGMQSLKSIDFCLNSQRNLYFLLSFLYFLGVLIFSASSKYANDLKSIIEILPWSPISFRGLEETALAPP